MAEHSRPQDNQRPSTQKKRLIVCCDGTWQAADRGNITTPSNVARLSRMLAREDTEDGKNVTQVVYYQGGVGSNGTGTLISDYLPIQELSGFVTGVFQATFGWGLDENIIQCYHFLSQNYNEGDEIFMFGFSRGAYTARSLAGVITTMGLLKPRFLHDFRRAYQIYREYGVAASKTRGERIHEELPGATFWTCASALRPREDLIFINKLREKMYDDVTVKAIGVWETVGALGLPDSMMTRMFPSINERFKFHDAALNGRVENAFQALALDEHRGAFSPSLWYLDPQYLKTKDQQDDGDHTRTGPKPRNSLENKKVPNLKQCWFPGYHESVGGGNTLLNWWMPDNTDIDDLALAWMCDQIEGLLKFDREAVDRVLSNPSSDDDDLTATGRHHHHGRKRHRNKNNNNNNNNDANDGAAPHRHNNKNTTTNSWALGRDRDLIDLLFFFRLDIAGGDRVRTPGQYWKGLAHDERADARDFATNETMHPSVRHRIDAFGRAAVPYSPPALRAHGGWLHTPGHVPAPAWRWEEKKSSSSEDCWASAGEGEVAGAGAGAGEGGEPDGWGARWVRPGVPPQAGWWWWWSSHPRQRKIVMREWVIREMEGRVNFEARLLPWLVKEQLWARNRRLMGGGEGDDHEKGGAAKQECAFWTRSNWGQREVLHGVCRVHGAAPVEAAKVDAAKTDSAKVDAAKMDKQVDGNSSSGKVNEEVAKIEREVVRGSHRQDSVASLKPEKAVKNGRMDSIVDEYDDGHYMNGGAVQAPYPGGKGGIGSLGIR